MTQEKTGGKIAIYPGSFDPITNGHVDIIKRGSRIFDKIIVLVAYNPRKSFLFSMEERCQLIREIFKGCECIQVDSHDGLLIDYLQKSGASTILRGMRALSDFEYAFPRPESLANAEEQALKSCGLGYRVPYIKKTSQMVACGEVSLSGIALLDDVSLEEQLLRFPGVGRKVASCVMLFSYGRMDVFPVDTWISKVLDNEYRDGFPFDRYQGIAGILQQYLFCYARHLAGRA